MTRLVQLRHGTTRRVALVEEPHLRLLGGAESIYELANEAALRGTSLLKLAPSTRMPEVAEPVTIGTYDVFLVVGSELSDADANKMTSVLIDSWADLQKDYPALRAAKLSDLSRATNVVPYHPGAIAAFKAKNMWSAQNEMADKKIM